MYTIICFIFLHNHKGNTDQKETASAAVKSDPSLHSKLISILEEAKDQSKAISQMLEYAKKSLDCKGEKVVLRPTQIHSASVYLEVITKMLLNNENGIPPSCDVEDKSPPTSESILVEELTKEAKQACDTNDLREILRVTQEWTEKLRELVKEPTQFPSVLSCIDVIVGVLLVKLLDHISNLKDDGGSPQVYGNQLALELVASSEERANAMKTALNVILSRCLVCGRSNCTGTCLKNQRNLCYKCNNPKCFNKNNCTPSWKVLKSSLRGVACSFCYCPLYKGCMCNDYVPFHQHPVKEKIKALLQREALDANVPFVKKVEELYATNDDAIAWFLKVTSS